MSNSLSFILGFASAIAISVLIGWREWRERGRIQWRLEYLERNLCCGKGVFGCKRRPKLSLGS